MKRLLLALSLPIALAAGIACAAARAPADESATPPPAGAGETTEKQSEHSESPPPPTYDKTMKPLFTKYGCVDCHNPEKMKKSKYDLTTYQAALKEVKPGNVEASNIVKMIATGKMPPKKASKPVTPEDLATLKAWILAGAPEK